MAPKATAAASASTKLTDKPGKPDEAIFRQTKEALGKELQDVRDQLKVIKEKIPQIEPQRATNGEKSGPSPVQRNLSALRAELDNISNQQSGFKSSQQKIRGQIESLETALKQHKETKQKMRFKTLAEIEAEIARLDSLIESGTMKIVEEKRAIDDTIPSLRRDRKALEAAEENISQKEAKITELKAQVVDTPEQGLNDRYNEINTEIKQLSALWNDHTTLRRLENEKINAMRKLERDFHAGKAAYRAYQNAAYQARREKVRAEREAKDREYRLQSAAKKLAEASQPAFQSEINTCEGLIAHFDPASPEAQATKTKASLHKDAGLKALATRVVETEPKGRKLVREEEDYFIGKPKKGKRGPSKAVTPTVSASTDEKSVERGKFQLNHGILVELGKVDVRAPSCWDDIPACMEKLRERLIWYKENSERVTKENIAKVQQEIDGLEDISSKEDLHKTLAAEDEAAHDPTDVEEEEKPLPVPSTIECANNEVGGTEKVFAVANEKAE